MNGRVGDQAQTISHISTVTGLDDQHSAASNSSTTNVYAPRPDQPKQPGRKKSLCLWIREKIRNKSASESPSSQSCLSFETLSSAGVTINLLSERERVQEMGLFRSPKCHRSEEDYLTGRGANPQTGLISPSITSLASVSTPKSAVAAWALYSPFKPESTESEKLQLAKCRSSSQRWRCDEKEWWTEPAPIAPTLKGRSVSAFSSPHQSKSLTDTKNRAMPTIICTDSDATQSLTGTDRFIIRMPSGQEPQPYAYPGYTAAQIEAAQRGWNERSISGGSRSMPGTFVNGDDRRLVELDASPSPSPPTSYKITTEPQRSTFGTVIRRKPVGSAGSSVKSFSPDRPDEIMKLLQANEQARTNTDGTQTPYSKKGTKCASLQLMRRDDLNPVPHYRLSIQSPQTPTPLPRIRRSTLQYSTARESIHLKRMSYSNEHDQRTRQKRAVSGTNIPLAQILKIVLIIYLLVCIWYLLDTFCSAVRTLLWPFRAFQLGKR